MKIKKVLVSQPKPASEKSPYYDIAQKYGVKIDFRPFIKVECLSAKEFRQQKVSILDHTAVIFTSRHVSVKVSNKSLQFADMYRVPLMV